MSVASMKAFEFHEEDDRSECVFAKLTSAYEPDIQFKESGNSHCSEKEDEIDDQHDHNISCSVHSIDDCAANAINRFGDACLNSPTCDKQPHFISNTLMQGNVALIPQLTSANETQSNWASHQSSSCDDSVDEMSDVDRPISNTESISDVSKDAMDVSIYNRFSINWKMVDRNIAVVRPDLIICNGRHHADAMLIFSDTCIELKTSADYGHEVRWEIADLVDMKIHFADRLEIALIKLHVTSNDANQADNEHQTSGIEEIIFVLDDSKWLKKQEVIASLDDKYKDLMHFVNDGETLISGSFAYDHKKSYFRSFDYPNQQVIYPKEDPDSVSVSKRDFDLLQPDVCVNDTIIDFYIKYVKNKIHPGQRHRFHFFNSFFFRKLIDLDKDAASTFKSVTAFQRVRKWTRKIDIFEKDYIFIPVNFSYHWSLIIICHPGDVVKSQDKDAENCLRLPCILHMNSFKGTHDGLKNIVQSYLWEEWKERQKESSEDISRKFLNLRFVPLELPQQQNSFDCGLFLLHYAECFVDDAPDNFNPFRITKVSNFLNVNWFHPAEASLKRGSIQRLIHDMLMVQTSETNNGSSNGDAFPLELNFQGNVSSPPQDMGIEITLLPARTTQYGIGNSGLVPWELPGEENATSYVKDNSTTFDQAVSIGGFRIPIQIIEQDDGANEHFVPTLNENNSMVLLEEAEPCLPSFSDDSVVMVQSHSLSLDQRKQNDQPNSSNHSPVPNDTPQIASPNLAGCFTSFSTDPCRWSFGVGKSDGNHQNTNGNTEEELLYNLEQPFAYLDSINKLVDKTNVFELSPLDPMENKLSSGVNSMLPTKRKAEDSRFEIGSGEGVLEYMSVNSDAKRLRPTPC